METVKRASKTTSLALGLVEAPVKLFKTMGDEGKALSFVTAGPNGKPLRREERPVEASVEETPEGDAFGLSESGDEDPTVVPAAEPPKVDLGDLESQEVTAEKLEQEAVTSSKVTHASSVPGTFKAVMVEEETGVEVEPENVRRGVRKDDGEFVDLTDLLERIDQDSKEERLQVLDFIRRERVPRERIIGSYYLAAGAAGYAPRVLRILYEAMRRSERVAVVRWTKAKGQTLGLLVPHSSGALVVLEVAFAEAARKPNSACLAHMKAEVSDSHVRRAVELIDSMKSPPSVLDGYANRRVQLQRDLVDKALKGELDPSDFEVIEKPTQDVERLDELLVTATGS